MISAIGVIGSCAIQLNKIEERRSRKPDEQDLDKIKEILPGLAKEFFSKFPAKDNHRLNLYADILGFFCGSNYHLRLL